jgi:pimeloyl-ACP methyl ester carboxylesterase
MLQSETVTLPDGATWQVLRGGHGPRIVWLHGTEAPRADDPFLAALRSHAEVIAPIMPGFTDLIELDDIDDIHDLALAYDDLLAAMDLGDICLAGHSVGGMIAAEVAAHVPMRIARLALVAPFGLWDDRAPVIDIFAMPPSEQLALFWHDKQKAAAWSAAREPGEDPAQFEQVMVSTAQANTSVAKFIWPIPDKGLHKRLHRIAAPSLLLWGREDQVVPPSYAQAFSAELAQAQTMLISGAGHMVPYEKPEDVAQALARFVG